MNEEELTNWVKNSLEHVRREYCQIKVSIDGEKYDVIDVDGDILERTETFECSKFRYKSEEEFKRIFLGNDKYLIFALRCESGVKTKEHDDLDDINIFFFVDKTYTHYHAVAHRNREDGGDSLNSNTFKEIVKDGDIYKIVEVPTKTKAVR